MSDNIKKIQLNIFKRYITLFLFSLIFLLNFFTDFLIYILNKLTFILLSLFYNISIQNQIILITNSSFEITKECVANHGYILIAILIFTFPFKFKESVLIFLKSSIYFTIFNLIRIIILILIQIIFGQYYFDLTHMIFYEFLSAIISSLIVLHQIKLNKKNLIQKPKKQERTLPFFTDLNYLIKIIKK